MEIVFNRVKQHSSDKINHSLFYLTAPNEVYDFVMQRYSITTDSFNNIKQPIFNRITKTMPIGLWYDLYQKLKERFVNANIVLSAGLNLYENVDKESVESFISGLGLPFEARDYQVDACHQFAMHKRMTYLSATGSGKTLMFSLMAQYAIKKFSVENILFVVPRAGLVQQGCIDFASYNMDNKLFSKLNKDKIVTSPITVTTWQLIQNMPASWFSQFDMLVVDECQHSDSAKLKKIANACINAKYRVGFSGSLKDDVGSELIVESLFGYQINGISAKEGQDSGYMTPIKLTSIALDYSPSDKMIFNKLMKSCTSSERYQKEVEFIIGSNARSVWLNRFVQQLDGNVLILYERAESHLDVEARKLDISGKKNIHIIKGDVPIDERVDIKHILETSDNNILNATFGTFQMGESVKNLHHLVLAHSSKSKVRVLQSIGRMMRQHSSKEFAYVWDLTDVLVSSGRDANYFMEQLMTRYKYYAREGYEIEMRFEEL